MKNNYISLHLATSKIFFACILCFLLAGVSTIANAQVTVSGSIGDDGNYSNLRDAFIAINTGAAQTGKDIVITLTSSYSTSTGATLNAGAWTSLKIYPTSPNITITGDNNMGTSLITLNGACNVTIDGRVNQTGAADLTLLATSSNKVYVLTFSESAQFNTAKFCTFKSNSNVAGSGSINFSTASVGTGNDFNTIDNCNITSTSNSARPVCGIYSNGTSTAVNSSNIITNNKFFNFGNDSAISYGIFIESNSTAFTINGNHFYQPVSSPTSNYGYSYININTGDNYKIQNNFMGGQDTYCGGNAASLTFPNSGTLNFYPIYINVGLNIPSTIEGNTIKNFAVTAVNPNFTAIYVAGGDVDIIGNTIGATTGTGSITLSSSEQNNPTTAYIIRLNSLGNINILNNIVGSIKTVQTNSTPKPYNLYVIYEEATTGSVIISGNTIGSEVTPSSIQTSSTTSGSNQSLFGIYTLGTSSNTISANTIANFTNNSTYYSATTVPNNNLAIYSTAGSNTISDNIIHDFDTPMSNIGGIYVSNTTAGTIQSITGNTIYTLKNTNTDATKTVKNSGIYFNGPANSTANVLKNYIYDLRVASNSNSSSTIEGINAMLGNTNYHNNIIYLGKDSNQPTQISGILDGGTATMNNIFHNTVLISGTTTSSATRTSAYYKVANTGSSTVTNNIFSNTRNGGTGTSNYSAYISTDKTRLAINYNDYYVGTTNSTYGSLNGAALTVGTISTATNLGANSTTVSPPFTNAIPTVATDFRLSNQLGGDAALVTTVLTDYGGEKRTTPTIGAWEFGFLSSTPTRYFSYMVGKGPSTEQFFIVRASGLGTNTLTITPPTEFEVSQISGGIFSTSAFTLTPTGGVINDTIYIRLKAGLAVGSYESKNIALLSNGTTQNVICNGYVYPSITAGGGGSYCPANPINLTSTDVGVTGSTVYWEGPNNYYKYNIANPTIPATLTAANAGTYTVTANIPLGGNLITNPGFESGNVNINSGYTYVQAVSSNTIEVWPENTYTITDNPKLVHTGWNGNNPWTTNGAHSGSLQMVVNGAATSGYTVWSQQITGVAPNSTYQFSVWIQSMNPTETTPAQIQIAVNNINYGLVYTAPATGGSWAQYAVNIPTGNATTITLSLKNNNTAQTGNDFAIDDLSLQKVFTSSSSVDVSVITGSKVPNLTINADPGTTVEAGTSVTFTAVPYNGGTTPTYQWNLNGSPITGATNATYSYVPANGDEISCTMISNSTCATYTTTTSTKLTITNVPQRNFWKGNISTNWWDENNWTAIKVPEEGEPVAFLNDIPNNKYAQRDLVLDKDRIIGSFTNKVAGKKLIIPVATYLTVNGAIDTDSDPSRILVKAFPDGTQQNGSLYFPNATNVYGTVEMYSKSKIDLSGANNYQYFWQYFGIPLDRVKADPTLAGAYVRKSNESGTDDDTNYYWTELTNSDDLTAFDGYEICQPDPTTYTFSGKLVNWDLPAKQLLITSGAKYPGQYLFANPYTAAISVKALTFGSDMEWSVFLHNTGSFGNWTDNHGISYNGELPGQYISIPQAHAGESGIPGEVPSMSSMLVKNGTVSTVNSTFSIVYKNVAKKNETIQRVKQADGLTNTDVISTRIDLIGEHYSDRMWIFTEPTCTRNYDNGWDGRKILGSSLAPQIYAIEPDGDYQVNSVSDMHDTDLAFQAGDEVEYTLKFTHENIQRQYAGVYLVDLVENKTIDVTQNGSTYKFATAQSDSPAKRFKIITRHYEKNAPDSESQLKIFSAKSAVYIQNQGTANGDCTLYNIAGQAVRKLSFGPSSITTVSNLKQGTYVLSATTNGEKVSKRVIVQ